MNLEALGLSLHSLQANPTLSLHVLTTFIKLFQSVNILLYSKLPRYPNKNSHNETNEKGSGAQYSLSGAPLRSNSTTKNYCQFLAKIERFLSMLHS